MLLVLLATKHGYDLDNANNGVWLPKTAGDRVNPVTLTVPLHNGSHPKWNELAQATADKVVAELEQGTGKSLTEIAADSPHLLVQAAARVEALMRLHLANPPAAVITPDGRLR